MANIEHIEIFKNGVEVWNQWRNEDVSIVPDLSGANLSEVQLLYAKMSGVNLSRANLTKTNLTKADLSGANLSNANLSGAHLFCTDLSRADLFSANLSGAFLESTNFKLAFLKGADFTGCIFQDTQLVKTDLRDVKGLENGSHWGPSTIGIDTVYLSEGKIPKAFLRSCGVPEDFIAYLPSLIVAKETIYYYSCFISYSTEDEGFATRLHSRMRDAKLRVWFAPEDMKGGNKIFDQIENAIQIHDRLLLVLSERSMKSEWVFTEIRRALKAEKKEGRRKLFPIRLVDFELIKEWELIDADTGKDLAVEIRSYFIPDFSNWKNHDDFETAFVRLLKDLKAEEKIT